MNKKEKRIERPMSTAEAADFLGVCVVTLRAFCREGKIKFDQLPGKTGAYLIDRKSIRDFKRKYEKGEV
jgi:predicted site-specific integrase-resolvase